MTKIINSFIITCFVALNLGYAQTLIDGMKYMENENYTEAQKVFEQLIVKEPKNALPHYYLGQLKYALEDYKGADEAYNKGLLVSNKCYECTIGLAMLKLDRGQEAEAVKILDGVAKANKKNAAIHALVGDAFLYSKKPVAPKAIDYLLKSRDIDPKIAATWSHLGDAYKLSGDMGSAMNAYETAVEKDKNNIDALMSMAKIWANTRQVEYAIEKLESVIKLAPEYAPGYKLLYELYIQTRQMGKVVAILDKYTPLAGDDLKAKGRLVKFLSFQAKDHERAVAEGLKLKGAYTPEAGNKIDNKFYTINRWMASSYLELGKFQESFDVSTELFAEIAQDTSRKSYESDYETYAKAAVKLKKFDEAAKAYDNVIKLNPEKGEEIYGNFAKGYYDDKNYPKAIEFYIKKSSIKDLSVTDNYYLGISQYLTKDYLSSQKTFAKIIEISPSYVAGWSWLAKSYDALDETEPKTFSALPYYTKLIEVASVDKEKNKKSLIEAYQYLAYKNIQGNDVVTAKSYYEQVLALDPANQIAIQNLAVINGNK